jgi:hypothetical protein
MRGFKAGNIPIYGELYPGMPCFLVSHVFKKRRALRCREETGFADEAKVIIVKKGELTKKDRLLKNEVYLLHVRVTYSGQDQAW